MKSAKVQKELTPETRLDIESGMLYVHHQGSDYAIHVPSGTSYVFLGPIKVPDAKGVRFPQEWAKARLWMFVHRNFKRIMTAMLVAVALAVLQMGLALTYPGDYSAHIIAIFSYWMTGTLIVLFSLSLIGWAVLYATGGVTVIDLGKTKELPSGEISILPDLLIMTAPDESPESFQARLEQAMSETEGTQRWVVAVAKGQPTFVVLQNSESVANSDSVKLNQSVFLRNKAFDETEFIEYELNTAAQQFKKETDGQFLEWCRQMASDYKRWASWKKLGVTNHIETIIHNMGKATIFIFAILMPALLPAQKEAQVRTYLGDRADLIIPQSGEKVQYIWQNRELELRADGQANVVQLMKSVPLYSDRSEGKLLAIKVADQVIMPKGPSTTAAGEVPAKQEPQSALPIPQGITGMLDGLPDSSSAEAQKAAIMRDRAKDWVKIKPSVELKMWVFYQILGVVFILLAFLLWVAWVASADAFDDVMGYPVIGGFIMGCYMYAKAISAGIIFAVGAVFALEYAITFWFTGQVVNLNFFLKVAVLGVLWYYIAKKLLPNIKRNDTGGNSHYQSPYQNQKRLG